MVGGSGTLPGSHGMMASQPQQQVQASAHQPSTYNPATSTTNPYQPYFTGQPYGVVPSGYPSVSTPQQQPQQQTRPGGASGVFSTGTEGTPSYGQISPAPPIPPMGGQASAQITPQQQAYHPPVQQQQQQYGGMPPPQMGSYRAPTGPPPAAATSGTMGSNPYSRSAVSVTPQVQQAPQIYRQ